MAVARQCVRAGSKLGTAIIGIPSIHLLKTFTLIGQTAIHPAFLLSAIAIGDAERTVYSVPRGTADGSDHH